MIVMRQPGQPRSTRAPAVPSLDALAEALALADLDWQDGALCAQTDPDIFYPELGVNAYDAKRVCAACPVRAECLAYALDHAELYGIWGGLSERQRERIRTGKEDRPAWAVAA